MILRILGFFLALLCLIVGAFGLGASHFPDSGLVATGRALLATLTGPLSALARSDLSADSIARTLYGLPALGLLGLGAALVLSSRSSTDDNGDGWGPSSTPTYDVDFRDKASTVRYKDTGGYGLGLSLCKTIMEAHDGKIEVQSRPEEGTTVSLFFPLT